MDLIDMFAVKQLERVYKIKITQDQIEEARMNDGEVKLRIDGRNHYIKLPLLKFPHDLLSADALSKCESGLHD